MLRDENAANQAVIDEKNRVLREFNKNVGRLIDAPIKQVDIAKLCDLHNQYTQQLHVFRQKNLLTFQEADEIASNYYSLSPAGGELSLKQSKMLQDQAKLDFDLWYQYKRQLLLNTASNIFQLDSSEIDTAKHYGIRRAMINASIIINDCKAGELSPEQIRPIIIAVTNFLVAINLEIAQQPDQKKVQSLKILRDDAMHLLNTARNHRLINGEDAYRIACAIDFKSKSKSEFTNEKDEQLANLQIVDWKNYAINAGNMFAIREINSETNDFILRAWKQFLKDTTPKKLSLFQDSDRNAAIDLQKQLVNIAEGDASAASSKHMMHLIATFYLDQLASKGPKDNFLSKLSVVIIDILAEMSQWDEKIKTVLAEEGENAHSLINKRQGAPKGIYLKSLLLQGCPITLNNILTSLHMTHLEVNRASDLGPEYLGPGYDTGHGL